MKNATYRAQLMHHAGTTELREVLFVVTTLGRIIRVVHIIFPQVSMEYYKEAMLWISEKHLSWLDTTPLVLPVYSDHSYTENNEVILQHM